MAQAVPSIAVVGAGAVSPYGFQWRGLGAQLRAAPPRRELSKLLPDVRVASVPRLPDALSTWSPKQDRLMSRSARFSVIAMHAALLEAGWEGRAEEAGCYLGVGPGDALVEDLETLVKGTLCDGEISLRLLADRGSRLVNPLTTFRHMHNMPLCHGAIAEGLRGPNAAYLSRGAGTVAALMAARHAIAAGACAQAVVGAADSLLNPIIWAELSRRDLRTQDMLPSEGAAMLALLPADHARSAHAGHHGASSRSEPLAWLGPCSLEVVPPGDIQTAIGTRYAGHDLLIVASPSKRVREACMEVASSHLGPIDLSACLGEAMAASPALAWVAALDLLTAGTTERVLVVTHGVDQQLGMVSLLGPQQGAVGTRGTGAAARAPGRTSHRSTHPTRSTRPTRPTRPRPVITGVGVVSGFGVGTTPFLDGLAENRSAVRAIQSFDVATSPVRIAGEVPVEAIEAPWVARHLSDTRQLERLQASGAFRDRKSIFAVLAADEAWSSAGCGQAERDAHLCLALGLEQTWLDDFVGFFDGERFDWRAERRQALPAVRLRSPIELATDRVADHLQLRGPRVTHASACAAGAMAVAHAASLIETGTADVVLCGGSDSMVNPLGIGGFWSLGAPSARTTPDACRPFDASRDGLVIGEGAAVFVVESEDRARARGAAPRARLLGHGVSQDAYRATTPHPSGAAAARAMRAAMADAGVEASAIGWVNAHGTGTRLNDPAETRAIRATLGARADTVPVSSIKGAVGHLMAASGAIELAACLLPLTGGLIPATANHRERDPDCDLDIVAESPRKTATRVVLSNSFGFGGQNICVAIGSPS